MKNSLSLKKILALFAALTVFCLSLCSCTPADDEDDETAEDVNYSGAVLNVYNWGVYMDDGKGEDGDGSYIDEETTMNVNAAFEQYYKETYGEEMCNTPLTKTTRPCMPSFRPAVPIMILWCPPIT